MRVIRLASLFGVVLFIFASVAAFRGNLHAQTKVNARIVADVELVQIPVIVFDRKGAVAADLKKSDFRVLEDGVEQRILSCERDRESVSFVVLADVSSSMRRKIPFVQEAALSLLDPNADQSPYHDEFSFFGIETRVKRLSPFTSDQEDLEHRLPQLIEATNGSTALFDGLYAGVRTAQREAENKRRAIIVISDGGDNHSRYNLRETRKLLEEADMPVFAVMAGPWIALSDIFPMPQRKPVKIQGRVAQAVSSKGNYIGPAERRGPHNLKVLTEVTGGGVFTAHRLEDLPRIVQTIGNAVRYRYVLTYRPRDQQAANARSGDDSSNWHKIRVELAPKDKFEGYGMPYYKRGYFRGQ